MAGPNELCHIFAIFSKVSHHTKHRTSFFWVKFMPILKVSSIFLFSIMENIHVYIGW